MKYRMLAFAVSVSAFFTACGPDSGAGEEDPQEESADTLSDSAPQNVVYYAAPSPMEVVNMVESSKMAFDDKLLNPTTNTANYSTTLKKALNLGVYGADLSYTALFDQAQKSRDYLATVKTLSDELGMSGAFETEFLNQLESSISNRDSLMRVISEFYWNADSYLTENERSSTSSLMAAGGWIEGMYIATRMAGKVSDKQAMVQKIAEQKLTLKNLILLLKLQNSENLDASGIIAGLEDLKASFDAVDIAYSEAEVKTSNEEGVTRIGGSSTVTINDEQLAAITGKVETLRSSVIN